MYALVTGANGFIGSHLVDALLDRGWQVRILARPSSNLRWLPVERIEVVKGSLGDPDCIRKAVEGVHCVFHVAGIYRAPSLQDYRKVNVEPVRLMLEILSERIAAAEKAGVTSEFKRFVQVSSFAAAGPSPDGVPLTEDKPRRPVSDYGRSKAEAEEVVLSFREKVPVTVVRPPGVFGPRDDNFLAIFRQAKRGLVPKVGFANRKANLIYGPDFAEGLILAATSDKAVGQVYFMASEELTGNVELVKDIADALGVRVRRLLVPLFVFDVLAAAMSIKKKLTGKVGFLNEDRVATMRQSYWTANVEKMKRDLEWTPPTRISDGLRMAARWYKEQGIL